MVFFSSALYIMFVFSSLNPPTEETSQKESLSKERINSKRERERKRGKESEREREREREREGERGREREGECERGTERGREREREGEKLPDCVQNEKFDKSLKRTNLCRQTKKILTYQPLKLLISLENFQLTLAQL